MIETQTFDEVHLAFITYLDTYFVERNLENTFKMFSHHISGFGTGFDEKAYSSNEFKRLYSRDISQAPNSVHYIINKLHIESPVQDVGIVSCELDIKTIVLEQELSLNNLRLSMFFVKTDEDWIVEHMHISFPTLEQDQEEAYPIKELEERNKILQRLVNEKTKTLEKANQELTKALNEVKTLRGILPICSYCKKIRADDKSWHMLEKYIHQHSDAMFSHGICPDCAKEHYPDFDLDDKR